MLLSGRMLNNVANVNTFDYGTQVKFTEGDALTVYFQLIDANKDDSLKPQGRRYIPATGATLSVVVHNINDSITVTRAATNPFAGDTSIWALSILSTDALKGTLSLKLTLTEGAVVTRGVIKTGLSVEPQTAAFC